MSAGDFAPIRGLSAVAAETALLLCDVFGTLHDATRTFPSALAALRAYRACGGTVVLVSNAAEPGPQLARSLAAKGIAGVYDALVSAADVARILLAEQGPRAVLHLGPVRDRGLFEGLPHRLVAYPGAAELIVCTGYPDEDQDLDAWLGTALRAGQLMICTNPDTQITVAGRRLRFAGLVAARYRALGGRVVEAGKPGALIYREAMVRAAALTGRAFALDAVTGVGDTAALDAAGALAQGFRAIHLGPAPAGMPTTGGRCYRMPALAW